MRKIFYSVIFFLAAISFTWLAGELILAVGYKVTHKFILSTLIRGDTLYPANPERYIKIVVVGGSSGEGANSEKAFADIIDYELKKQYPALKVYVKNYSRSGYPFHQHEVESLKRLIDKYDIFLIYEGHNELQNYVDDIGFFKTDKYKSQKVLKPLIIGTSKEDIMNFLNSKSRIYAVLIRSCNKFMSLIKPHLISKMKAANFYENQRFKEFDFKGVLPQDEAGKINTNFEKDLKALAELAQRHGKVIIVSSVPVDESAKPFFSVLNPGLSKEERAIFDQNYEAGLKAYENKEYKDAISYLLKANEVDGHVSIVKYMVGDSYLKTGDTKKGRSFLMQSSDEDGYPIRSPSSLREIEKKVSERYKNVYFVDAIEAFHALLDKGCAYRDLFADMQHPNLLGHIIIAQVFLSQLSGLEPFVSYCPKRSYIDPATFDAGTTLAYYKNALNITTMDESFTAFRASRWCISTAPLSAYPEGLLNNAQRYITKFYDKSEKQSSDKVKMLVFTGLIDAERQNADCQKALGPLNEAEVISPKLTYQILNMPLCTGILIAAQLNSAGIYYSRGKGFYANEKT